MKRVILILFITFFSIQSCENNYVLQGNRIEHPDFIHNNKLELDYSFYITNQIMNPVKQVLDLKLDSKETELIFK